MFKHLDFFAFSLVCCGLTASVTTQASDASEIVSLVIDQGADLDHQQIEPFKHKNFMERMGQTRFDDDGDGFADNVSGWNHISQDDVFMPEYLLQVFKASPEQVKKDLAIYSRIEQGDKTAIEVLTKDSQLQNRLMLLLDYAHGTHVSGIVSSFGGPRTRIHNLNVFTPSAEGKSLGENVRILGHSSQLQKLATEIATESEESIFDSEAALSEHLKARKAGTALSTEMMSTYIRGLKPRVVNLSLGTSFALIYGLYQQIWRIELMTKKKPLSTPMSASQKKNFDRAVSEIFGFHKQEWARLFSIHPKVVFVVASGNDGSADQPVLGNLDVLDAVPASLAEYFPNVITVVATDKTGVIADFSNFSAKRTTIGAHGTAVVSAAPDNNLVALSGTSMAAPLVTGVVTRMLSENTNLKPAEVKQILERSALAHPSLKGKTSSGGFINKEAAVAAARKSLTSRLADILEEIGNWKSEINADSVFPSLNITRDFEHKFGLSPAVSSVDGEDRKHPTVIRTPDFVRERMKRLHGFL